MFKRPICCALAFFFVLVPALAVQTENLAQAISGLPWTGSGKAALELFKKAEQAGLADVALWFKLGLVLYDGQSIHPALGSFQHITQPETSCCELYKFGAYAWQGHIYDLLGKRQEALNCYKKALAVEGKNKGLNWRHDQFGLVVNRAWVKERLSKPFIAPGHDPQHKTQ